MIYFGNNATLDEGIMLQSVAFNKVNDSLHAYKDVTAVRDLACRDANARRHISADKDIEAGRDLIWTRNHYKRT